MKPKKISIIGAGNVGSMVASRAIEAGLGDVVLLDAIEDLAIGKAMDISDAGPILGYKNRILGTGDYKNIKDSDIVIVTAGFPRKPGMSREDLANKNAEIIKQACSQIKILTPDSIVIIVTNPLDVMSYLAMKILKFKPNRVIGCSGLLDAARFVNILKQGLGVRLSIKRASVLGSHSDSMVPLNRFKIPQKDFEFISKKTKMRGGEIVSKLGFGSASFAPSAAVLRMADYILNDKKEIICASAYLNGEYGLRDIYIGVPLRLGKRGAEEIIEVGLNEEETKAFRFSAEEIQSTIKRLCQNMTLQ